jgi:DNA-binding transcriptional regulator LsrR (DeoR family)
MNSLYSSVNSLEWRRAKVLELSSQGRSQPEIARILQIRQPTINRDLQYLRREAKENIRKYIDDKLPFEYQKCLVGLDSILARTWDIANNTESLEGIGYRQHL